MTSYTLIEDPQAIADSFPGALVIERFEMVEQIRADNIHWTIVRPGYQCREKNLTDEQHNDVRRLFMPLTSKQH
ncbi:MAG: hypothetical protein AAGB12_11575 [Pseudomonadota bacterium]